MKKDLLTIRDITRHDLDEILQLAAQMKKNRASFHPKPLEGKSVGLIFSKSSTRTRVSFEVGIRELGGYSIFLDQGDMQLGRGETIADTARVLSRYLHALVIRTHEHAEVIEFAKFAHIPVINALTNKFHPCQILADIFTIYELSARLEGVKIAYLGDCTSNTANSFILGAKLAGLELTFSSPEEYRPDHNLLENSNIGNGIVLWESNPLKAVKNAEYIYTDVWVSMGFENESEKRMALLRPYQVTMKVLDAAAPGAKVMHCLPAHRGEEITDEVLDSHQAVIFDQAENRLHVQKAILSIILKEE